MPRRRFLVTAALPYANGKLHVGHIAGAYLPADIFVRYLRSRGDEVAFVCGSDDHGVPILLTARAEGVSPREVVERYHAWQERDFRGLAIDFDVYGMTMSSVHHEMSRAFFRKVHAGGYLVKRTTPQFFDAKEGMFLPDRYVKGFCHHPGCGNPEALGDQCEKCGKTIDSLLLGNPVSVVSGTRPEVRKTAHWYFDLPRLSDRLRNFLELHEDWRAQVRNFALGLVREGLPERAMTRDVEWGVPVPLDDPEAAGKALYVWFDAPIGYVSFTAQWCEASGYGREDYEKWWKDPATSIVHFIGEDNTVFHAVIWPGMLMAEGTFQLPAQVVANSFLNIQWPGESEAVKFSKSRGTAIWIEDFLANHEVDPLRYYLTAIAPENQRTTYKPEEFATRTNDELVATLGNFIHRSFVFAHKYTEGKIPAMETPDDADREALAGVATLADRVGEAIEKFHFKDALGVLMSEARRANRYFDIRKPWETRKTDMARTRTTIAVCLAMVRAFGVVMEPFLPIGAGKVRTILGLEPGNCRWEDAAAPLVAGGNLGPAGILWKKIEDDPPSA